MNIQFTDHRRFLTSLGLTLISLSVIIPWLILREPLFATTKVSELAELTTISQYNVTLRQIISFGLTISLCCVSPTFFISGAVLLALSFPAWLAKENWQEKQEFEAVKIEKELRNLEAKRNKDKEVKEKRDREISFKNKFILRLQEYNLKDYKIDHKKTDVGILSYDFIIRYVGESKGPDAPDILVMAKYSESSKYAKILELYFKLLVYELNKRQFHESATRAVAIILHKENAKSNWRLWEKNKVPFMNRSDIDFHNLTEQEFNDLTRDELLQLFFPYGILTT